MKRAIRFSVHSGRISRDERLHCFSFSVRKLPLGCLATSLLAMTIQLDRRPLAAGANGGGIKAPSKPFSKLLQNSRVLLQAFPNKALAVLWDFKGLQGLLPTIEDFPNFSPSPVPFRPHFGRRRTAFRQRSGMGSRAFSGPRGFTEQLGKGRVHGSAVIRMERIFNVAGIRVFGKIYPSMSSKLVDCALRVRHD